MHQHFRHVSAINSTKSLSRINSAVISQARTFKTNADRVGGYYNGTRACVWNRMTVVEAECDSTCVV